MKLVYTYSSKYSVKLDSSHFPKILVPGALNHFTSEMCFITLVVGDSTVRQEYCSGGDASNFYTMFGRIMCQQ
jgi:hypothetical protein